MNEPGAPLHAFVCVKPAAISSSVGRCGHSATSSSSVGDNEYRQLGASDDGSADGARVPALFDETQVAPAGSVRVNCVSVPL